MQRTRILAEPRGPGTPYTTTDAARILRVTQEGVRFLVRDDQLACRRAPNGYRVFQEEEVLRLAAVRDRARLRGVRVLRPKRVGLRGGPRQLSLFGLRRVK